MHLVFYLFFWIIIVSIARSPLRNFGSNSFVIMGDGDFSLISDVVVKKPMYLLQIDSYTNNSCSTFDEEHYQAYGQLTGECLYEGYGYYSKIYYVVASSIGTPVLKVYSLKFRASKECTGKCSITLHKYEAQCDKVLCNLNDLSSSMVYRSVILSESLSFPTKGVVRVYERSIHNKPFRFEFTKSDVCYCNKRVSYVKDDKAATLFYDDNECSNFIRRNTYGGEIFETQKLSVFENMLSCVTGECMGNEYTVKEGL